MLLFVFFPLHPHHIYSPQHSSSGSAPARSPHHLSPSFSSSSVDSFLIILFLSTALGRSCDQGSGLQLLYISDFYVMILCFLFTLIVLHCLLRSAPLTTLRSYLSAIITLYAPLFLLCSSLILLLHSDPYRFFTCLQSLPLQYDILFTLRSSLSALLASQV